MQTAAAASHADIQAYSSGFRALACTAATDARDNTGTTGTGTDVPIYYLNGRRVSQDYEDLYDGSWDSTNVRDEDGVSAGVDSEAVTGCSSDGTADPDAPLGADSVRTGCALPPGYELSFQSRDNSDAYKVYGLSEVFEVGVASTSATLSGLAIEDASINRTIALTPSTFAATTTSYTASVARGVGEITVKPTVNESNATFVFLDGGDSELTDAGTSQDDFQVSVSQGANTIKVKVTAEDTSTTATYTVTVTRAVNAVPTFTDGVSTSRDFNETYADTSVLTASNIRTSVVATDTDANRLSYSLEGTDTARFGILPTDGQLQTKAGENYDYEAKSSYAVTVKVEDGSGGSATIAVTLNVTDRDEPPIAPDAPTVNATSGSATSLDVRWTAPSNTGRPAVTSYDLQYKKTIDSTWTDGPQSVTTTSATLTGLAAETAYEVQVRAENDEGAEAWSSEATGTTTALLAVTVSKTTLTVTEEDATGDSYTVVLDTQPTADVTVTVAGHAGTDLTPNPSSLTFTPQNWETAQTVTVTAADDADTTNDSVTLTHSATSTDADYDGITIADVTVTVNDNDTAQVMGVMVTPGKEKLRVTWTPVGNATGYQVQWKSGVEDYNTTDRQATVTAASHTILGLANGTEYTVQVIAVRTGANDAPPSAEVKGTPVVTPGVTVSIATLTVTEEDATGDSYTVVLDTLPTADVTVTVAGHASTDVTPNPSPLTFTSQNWETAQTVTVTAADDADTTNDSVTLTHTAASTDTDYDGVTFDSVTVTVNDNDTAQVMGVEITPGGAELVVEWTAVDNATGYKVQWKSGVEAFNTGDRQATVASGATISHTIPNLANNTEYALQVIATRTGANNGPPSAEVKGTPALPTAPGVTLTKSTLTVTEEDANGDTYTGGPRNSADGRCDGHRCRPREHGSNPDAVLGHADLHATELGNGPDGDGDRGRRCRYHERYGHADPQRDKHGHPL